MSLDAIALQPLDNHEISLTNLCQFLTSVAGTEFNPKPATENPLLHQVFPWSTLRYQHTAAMRSALVESGRAHTTMYLPTGGMAAMADWLEVRGSAAGVLFPAIAKGGKMNLAKPMSTQAIAHIVEVRGGAAGVQDIAPHDFRRTFVGNLLDAGGGSVSRAEASGAFIAANYGTIRQAGGTGETGCFGAAACSLQAIATLATVL